MKIPKGWPTAGMIEAAHRAYWDTPNDTDSRKKIRAALKEALAAAPIPPAQPPLRLLFDTDIERIALECGFKKTEQPDGRMALNPYVYRFARQIVAASDARPETERNCFAAPAQEASYSAETFDAVFRAIERQYSSDPMDDMIEKTHAVLILLAPPVQENQWEQAVLLQCMAVEGCYNESNPAATLECLIDWHVRNAAPPAQEAEPVAWRRTERDICDEYYTVYYDEETAPAGRGWEPLYAHPASDELRKAAEELQAYLKSSHLDTQIPRHIINNFSTALENK